MGKGSPVNAALTLPLGALKSSKNKVQSKHVAGRAQRLRGRNKAARPVPPWCRTERSGLRALAATQAGTRRGPGGVSPCRTETVRRHGPGRACQMLCVIAERPGGAVKAPCSSSWEIPPARRGIPGRGRVASRGVREGEPGPSLGAQHSGRVRRRWASGKV